MDISTETSKMLSKEHENILKIAEALESKARLTKTKDIDVKFFTNAIDFIKNYADKYHHAKEEDILFKEFNKCAEEGCVHCNPVEQMLIEHDEGRKNVKLMESGLKAKDKKKLIAGAEGYAQLIKEHIFKEDNILYPMADDAINAKTEKEMLKKFREIENTKKKEVKQYLNFVASLKKSK